MTLYAIKPAFQRLLRPLVYKMHAREITANQVTLFATVVSLLLGAVLVLFPAPLMFICLPCYLFIRMALNAIDGMLAREYNQQTTTGAILNETGDIISDAALYLRFSAGRGTGSGRADGVTRLADGVLRHPASSPHRAERLSRSAR